MAIELIDGVYVDTETGQIEINFSEAVANTLTLKPKSNGKGELNNTKGGGQPENSKSKSNYSDPEDEVGEEEEEVGVEEDEFNRKRWNN